MLVSYLLLAVAALLPVVSSVLFHFLEKFTSFKKLKYWPKQIILGIVFGGLAVVGTHWSIKFNGFGANARDAAVIICGFIFGGPAGIIAGTIGGLERLIVGLIPSFGLGFTVIACSVSTFVAGIFTAIIRRFAYRNQRIGIIPGFFTGLVIEVFHLFMVFVTNAENYQKAYDCIASCTGPMLIANSTAVLIALLVVQLLENGGKLKKVDHSSLTNRFVYSLSALTFISFCLSFTFVYLFNSNMIETQTNENLNYAISETKNEVSIKVLDNIYQVREVLNKNETLINMAGLQSLANTEGLVEINIVAHDGYIWHSSESKYDLGDFNMNDYEQSREFQCLVEDDGPETYVQDFRKMADEEVGEDRKYIGIKFTFDREGITENGYIQAAYNKAGVDKLVQNIALHKQVGTTGGVLVLNSEFEVVSKGASVVFPDDISPLAEAIKKENKENYTFEFKTEGKSYYAQYIVSDAHYIVSLIPAKEAMLERNVSVYINTFLEVMVFGLIFITTFVAVKGLVIDRIEKTNDSLEKITNGNLDEIVEGGQITEFKLLSKDINETVEALKGYIDAANKRIDEELAFAKAIQSAVLPSTFPAFPDRKEFDVFASMHPAKEVGGDFYDFYFSNNDMFHITIADVSGKGIPAALFMMRAKSVLKSLTQTNMPINEAFIKGNDSLCDGNEAGMFVTAWSSSINLKDGTVNFANGGHNPPLIKRKNGKFEYLRAPVNLVLAAMPGMPYKNNELKLEPGDTIYLYTDGVTEGVNKKDEQLGEKRLQDILNSKEFDNCQELCEYVYNECVKFADGAAQFDDITMLAYTYKGTK